MPDFPYPIVAVVLLVVAVYRFTRRRPAPLPLKETGGEEPAGTAAINHDFLEARVEFYRRLPVPEKERFRRKMARFLKNTTITGVDINLTPADLYLVAASAVIPVFYFQEWDEYPLEEVMIYASSINPNFETDAHDSDILGMVGTGAMEGKMALSRVALLDGFANRTDKHNTAIHEFVHLIDKKDGLIDGLPKILMDQPFALPWLRLLRHKMENVRNGAGDIHEYAGTNLAEFFAVSAEYFFERPELLKIKHPELYQALDYLFRKAPPDQETLPA